MRILMLAQFYPPFVGGEELHVRNLSIELAARGHDVAVATLWQEGLAEFEQQDGVRIYRIRGSMQRLSGLFQEKEKRNAPPFPDPEVLLALRKLVLQERPEIVHAHNWLLHSFTPLKAWSKAKLVVTLHDCSFVCATQQFLRRGELCSEPGMLKCLDCVVDNYGLLKGLPIAASLRASSLLARQVVDRFLPVSKAIATSNQLAERGASYQIIPNFIPDDISLRTDETSPLLEQLPAGDFLLFVGSVGRDKGVEVLLKAYAALHTSVPLVLIGQKETGFDPLIPPNVFLLDRWPHAAVMSAWKRATIALMPSICLEACPTVTMEAMAMGKAVVASRIGGLTDIVVEGETGLLTPVADERALGAAIQRLLDNPIERERMGQQAKQRVQMFQAEAVVPLIEHVYEELTGSSRIGTFEEAATSGPLVATPTTLL